jgi:hypothetical protein
MEPSKRRQATKLKVEKAQSSSSTTCRACTELGIYQVCALVLRCDKACATYLASNPMFHARTNHIEVDYHFFREKGGMGAA